MTSPRLELIGLTDLPIVRPGDDLAVLISDALARAGLQPAARDVVVVAQKIVSKAEDRFVDLATVTPSARAQTIAAETAKDPRLVEVILSETRRIVRKREGVLIVEHRLGFVMANAGVDQSNVAPSDGRHRVLMLPRDPDASAEALHKKLSERHGCDIAVIINDSFGRAWRPGTTGVALGAAGICAAAPTCSAAPCRRAWWASPTRLLPPRRWSWARGRRRFRSCWSAACPGRRRRIPRSP